MLDIRVEQDEIVVLFWGRCHMQRSSEIRPIFSERHEKQYANPCPKPKTLNTLSVKHKFWRGFQGFAHHTPKKPSIPFKCNALQPFNLLVICSIFVVVLASRKGFQRHFSLRFRVLHRGCHALLTISHFLGCLRAPDLHRFSENQTYSLGGRPTQ